ncbi:hypothetical protein ACFL3H_06520 [Gemmatimonadota bacterium]
MKRVDQGGSLFWKLIILVFTAALAATIFVPMKQRAETDYQIKMTRLHLIDLFLAEEFYFAGRQYYTADMESLTSYINTVRTMRIDTVDIAYYAAGDSIKPTYEWKIVGPRERLPQSQVLTTYRSPIDSSAYLLIVRDDGISITVKDQHGIGRIENRDASWLQGRRGG